MRFTLTEEIVFDPGRNGWVVTVGPTGVPKLTHRKPAATVFGLLGWRLRNRQRRTFTVAVRPSTMLRRNDVYVEECESYEAAVQRASEIADQIRTGGASDLTAP